MISWIDRSNVFSKKLTAPDIAKPRGGTEILLDGLYKNTNINNYNDINIVLSNPNLGNIKYTKKNLLWQHLNYNDESIASGYNSTSFMKSVDSFVYVSNWQYEKYKRLFDIPTENSYVIKNAINPIEFIKREKTEKIKLIYISTPFRGLDVLLKSFEILNRDDIELDIYSSLNIYGYGYGREINEQYENLFTVAKNMKNVNYLGYAENKEIHKALQSSHIFSYPSTFEETCCLAMIEAGAAGCKMVTTNLGALYETGSEYARLMPMQYNLETLSIHYAKVLDEEINNYWSNSNQESLKAQSDFYNKYYSWENKSKQWNLLFDKISSN